MYQMMSDGLRYNTMNQNEFMQFFFKFRQLEKERAKELWHCTSVEGVGLTRKKVGLIQFRRCACMRKFRMKVMGETWQNRAKHGMHTSHTDLKIWSEIWGWDFALSTHSFLSSGQGCLYRL